MIRRCAWVCTATMFALAAVGGYRELSGATSPEPTSLDRGGQAYLAQCTVCHGPMGKGDGPLAASIIAEHKRPPAVLDSARVASLGRAGVLRAMEGDVHRRQGSTMPLWGPHLGREWMGRIADFVVRMPSMGATGRGAISRYLAAPKGTPPSGRRTYVIYCSGCHGPQGGGDGFYSPTVGLETPPIRGELLRAVDDAKLALFISPNGPHAQNAPTMPGWLYTLSPDERAALVTYLRVLPGTPEAH